MYFSLFLHSLKLQASPYAISGQAMSRKKCIKKTQIKTFMFFEMNAGGFGGFFSDAGNFS